MKKTKLSIIILNYKTKELLRDCLLSLKKVKNEVAFEVIVCDNGSDDTSVEMTKKLFPWVTRIVENKKNLGFAAGNNKARPFAKGEYILFLNTDTIVYKGTLPKIVDFMDKEDKVGAVTCKVLLKNGKLDKDTRRAFITPWIGLTHIYLKLDRLFPKSKLFAKYWYGYISDDRTHEVDAIQGAFFLARKKVLDEVGWFDEDYFLDGEDIDLSWKIKNAGWKIVYYPKVSILHLKGATKGKNRKSTVAIKDKLKYRTAGVDSMELFFRKRMWSKYPLFFKIVIIIGIRILKCVRIVKTIAFG